MTSYMTSCSVEIGGFCDLFYLDEFHFFLEWVLALKAALMVFRDIEKPYTVALGSRSRKVTPAMGYFRSSFRPLFFNFTAILSLRDDVKSKTNARFGISAYELTTYDPPCVNPPRPRGDTTP